LSLLLLLLITATANYCHRLGSSAAPLLLNVAAFGATVVVGVLGATVVVESATVVVES